MATREGRGVLRAKATTGNKATVDIGSLLQVTADDIAEEISTVKKNKVRIEKNNERLEEEEKKHLEQEDKWTKDIASLETSSRTTISQLEEKINKTKFDWTRDRAADDRELERLNQKLDTIENEMDTKQDKREAKQLAEINALKEELAALENSGAEQVTNLGRLENLFAQLQDDKKKATEEGVNLKREIDTNTRSLDVTNRELATYEESLVKSTEKDEASRADLQARNELEEAISSVKKEIKAAQKADESDKKELVEMNELRDQLEGIKKKNDAMNEEIEKLKENLEKEKSDASKKSTSSDAPASTIDSGVDDKPVLSADLGAEKKSDAERQIEELEIELKRVEFEWNEKKAGLDEKIADLKSEEERVKASILRLQNDTKALEKDLTTARDNFTKDSREKADGLRQAQGETTTLDREIDKVQKDLDKLNSRDQAGKRTLQEKKFELLQTEQSVQASSFVLGFLTEREQKIETQQKVYAEKIREAKLNLKDTEDKLKSFRDEVAELNETMREYIKRNEALVEKFAEECFKEMGATEALSKQRESLRAEIARLRAYMSRDSIGLDSPDAKEDMYTAAIEKIVEERRKEMAAISKQLRGNKTKDERSLQDLTNDWARLVKEKEAYWDATSEYFVNIIGLLKQLPISKIETFQIPLYLLENDVAAGVLIEVGALLRLQKDGHLSNLLQSASYNIKQAFRDVKSGEVTDEEAAGYKHTKYSHALLKRLATLRSTMACRRVNGHLRIYEYCMFAIMEGEDDWEEEEYQNFIEEEEKLNQAKINAANEAKKKYAEDKAHWAKKREEKAVRGASKK